MEMNSTIPDNISNLRKIYKYKTYKSNEYYRFVKFGTNKTRWQELKKKWAS